MSIEFLTVLIVGLTVAVIVAMFALLWSARTSARQSLVAMLGGLVLTGWALLAAGFYFAYRKPAKGCEPGSECEIPAVNRAGRLWLWIATAFVILFSAFPLYSGPVARFLLSNR